MFRIEVLNHQSTDQPNYRANANDSNVQEIVLMKLRVSSQYGSCVSIENRLNKAKKMIPIMTLENCASDNTILILDQTKTF